MTNNITVFPIGKSPLVYLESDDAEQSIGVGAIQCTRCGTMLAEGIVIDATGAFDIESDRFLTHLRGECQPRPCPQSN